MEVIINSIPIGAPSLVGFFDKIHTNIGYSSHADDTNSASS